MYNKFMSEKEINVKVGDKVNVQGCKGTVTEVFHNVDTEWDGTEYVKIPGTESTSVTVHFDDDTWIVKEGFNQYQDGHFGNFAVVK